MAALPPRRALKGPPMADKPQYWSMYIAAILGVCCAVLALPSPEAQAQKAKDIPYTQGYTAESADSETFQPKTLLLHTVDPPRRSKGPYPAVIMLHGGSFRDHSKDHPRSNKLARDIARGGYKCFLINYRLMGDHPPAPYPWNMSTLWRAMHAAFVDAKAAVRHVRAHAEEYNIDPDRIAILGESAGAFAAIAAGVSGPEEFIYDRDDLKDLVTHHPGTSSTPNVVINLWGAAELVLDRFSPGDPPMLTIHGRKDTNIGTYFQFAENIVNACRENDIPYRFHVCDDCGHGAWRIKIDNKELPALIRDFLDEHL